MEETKCKCDDGTPVVGVECRDESIQHCLQCDENYSPQLVNNTASFWYDIPYLQTWAQTYKCVPNKCTCDQGYPTRECAADNKSSCESCHSTGYSVNKKRECKPNSCTCENGTADTGHNCEDDGFEDCDSCNNFFHQVTKANKGSQWYQGTSHHLAVKKSCQRNICSCPNGVEKTGDQCKDHDAKDCVRCNNGYTGYLQIFIYYSSQIENKK